MSGLKLKYFVLNPESSDVAFALASRAALHEFADQIWYSNKELAGDIYKWINSIAIPSKDSK